VIAGEELEIFLGSLRHATARHTGEALDDALDELAWREALAADRRAAVSTLFELQGATNATSSALDLVVATALGVDPAERAGVVLPVLGRCQPPGQVTGESVTIRGLSSAALPRRDHAVVVAGTPHGHVIALVATADLTLRTAGGLDPAIGMVEVAGDRVSATTRSASQATTWAAAVAEGRRAVGHELVGASRKMLLMAREHALQRDQFGRPIASFQAVRHRLADSLVAIEAADAALGAAWDVGSPTGAALAKAIAGDSARTVVRHCQQVLAGIGFTTEHPFHRYLRRTLVLDGLLGDARSLTKQLGEDLLRTRQLPPLLPL